MMKVWFYLTAVWLLTFVFAKLAFAADVIPLADYYQQVSSYYPRLKAANADVHIALAEQLKVAVGFWPRVGFSASYALSDDPVAVFGMLLRQKEFASADFDLERLNSPRHRQNFRAALHGEYVLFDAMQTIYRTKAAVLKTDASKGQTAMTGMEAFLFAQEVYINTVALHKAKSLLSTVREASAEDLRQAGELKDKGVILGADYYSARALHAEFLKMENELGRQIMATEALANILRGKAVTEAFVVNSSFAGVPTPPKSGAELLQIALQERPDLRALAATSDAASFEVAAGRASALPTVSVFAEAANDRAHINENGGMNATVGVSVDLPLFDPGRKPRVSEAEARKERALHELQARKDSVAQEVSAELSRLLALHDNLRVLKSMTADAKEAVVLMVPLYNEGRKSIAELMQARQAYLQAAQAEEKALASLWMSQARLLFVTGQLQPEIIAGFIKETGL